ncbi:hypothetical protein EVAR_69453_1 [Eumeta japonica]|uniref:Uncharacterized protein n=1 Tax=Eumeta variegata TaxID=151549 RepID=A0A4C1SBF0_EUMVA|nr:hypothetical protein EVAR_69453_1 [Eumeta japonica]
MQNATHRWPSNLPLHYESLSKGLNIDSRGMTDIEHLARAIYFYNNLIPPTVKLLILRTFHANQAHPQEIADSHIHQGARSVKTTNTTSSSGPLSCNGQRAKYSDATESIFNHLDRDS